ncbi:hypothetical protein ACWPOB_18420 [Rhodococcus sp. 2H158]|nr:hypothetical protein GQ85_15905 [Rhodococcus rhodochrous]
MPKNRARRAAALAGLVAAPLALGATVGTASASAAPWQFGPIYRSEWNDEGFCGKAQLYAETSRQIILVRCTYDSAADVWYFIAFDPATGS